MRATVSGYSDYSYIYAALTSPLIFTFVVVQSSRRGLAENAPTIHPQLIVISKESMSYVGSSAAGNKQSNITSSYNMSGERPAILVGNKKAELGLLPL